jgi:hypothetical protein
MAAECGNGGSGNAFKGRHFALFLLSARSNCASGLTHYVTVDQFGVLVLQLVDHTGPGELSGSALVWSQRGRIWEVRPVVCSNTKQGRSQRCMKHNGSVFHTKEGEKLWQDFPLMTMYLLRGNALCNWHWHTAGRPSKMHFRYYHICFQRMEILQIWRMFCA